VAPALAYVAGHYAEDVYISQLARLCHVSVPYFRRLMRAATGVSPQEYITHMRLQMAASLLVSTNKRVLDIAMDTGFPTLSSFNRHFKEQLRCSPREWRTRGQE
jgi:AraC-like DNA-binding protein